MYLVAGQRYEAHEHGLERALAAAYGERIRPLCLCSEPSLPVYITRLGVTFVLKRMPFTGSQHAVGCSHYEPPAELSALGEVLGSAISVDPDTGLTRLRVGFSLSKGAPRAVDARAAQDSASARSDGSRLSLRGLVHFLWREAELTKWRPAFAGKRSWAVVRSHLLSAASNKLLKGLSLVDALYVPEAFTVADAQAIRGRRRLRFAQGLRRPGQTGSKMILIGELKEIVPTRSHFNVVVKHMPDAPFSLSTDLHRSMIRRFESELALCTASAETHLIIGATYSLADWGQPMIDELCLVSTTAQWLPVDDGFEKQLTDRLVSERRAFDKSLGFNSKLHSSSTSAVLLDAPQAPVALVLDRTGDSQLAGHVISPRPVASTWRWQVHATDLPALPR